MNTDTPLQLMHHTVGQPSLPSIRQSDEDERRTFDSEDIEDWQYLSERQGAE